MNEFYEAWNFIQEHPRFVDWSFSTFPYGLEIIVVKVNPKNKKQEKDESKNTLVQIWLEYGPAEKDESTEGEKIFTHDIDLDCGADTFEFAVIELARLIKIKYGNYTET